MSKQSQQEAVYIAGPMTGLPDYNYREFNRIADHLRKYGFEKGSRPPAILNPAEALMADTTLGYEFYMRSAIHLVLQADTIVLLPGWEESRGATMEVLIAQRLGLTIRMVDSEHDGLTFPEVDLPSLGVAEEGDEGTDVEAELDRVDDRDFGLLPDDMALRA